MPTIQPPSTNKSSAQAFATVFHKIAARAKTALEWEQTHVAPESSGIEDVTGLIPGLGGPAEDVEKLAFAALGALAVVVHATPQTTAGTPTLSKLAKSTGI